MTELDKALPTYFQTINSLPIDDRKVEIITLDLAHLPKDIDELDLRKTFFANHHIIKIDTVKDNITGHCNGRGKVQIRVADPNLQK